VLGFTPTLGQSGVATISFSYDEVTTLDQQSYVSIHAYVVENWLHTHYVVIPAMSG
jgi:hypothetical protein